MLEGFCLCTTSIILETMIEFLQQFIAEYGIFAVFITGLLEEVLFFIPSSLIFLAAGFFIIPPDVTPVIAVFYSLFYIGLPTALGVTLGAFPVYGLVYMGGKPAVMRWGKYIGIEWSLIEMMTQRLRRGYYDEIILFVVRVIPIFPIAIVSAACGFLRISLYELAWTTFFGTLLRASGVSLFGWIVSEAYTYYAEQFFIIERYGFVVFIVAVLGIFGYLHYRK